jgi:predicted transcriptional regulator
MFEVEENVENVVFQALSHPMRRTILRIMGSRPEGISYSELITELNLSTGKLNYHLEQLWGLAERDPNHRYVLTTLGRKALNQLGQLRNELSPEDEKFVKMAESSQKSSLQPAARAIGQRKKGLT